MGTSGIQLACLSIMLYIIPGSVAVDANCNFQLNPMVTGQSYTVALDPFYPGQNCLWNIKSLPGTRIYLTCSVNMPYTANCGGDKLKVSLSGSTIFNDAQVYCGSGSFSVVSNANALAIGLVASYTAGGGSFICTIKAVQTSTPAPSTCKCGMKRSTRIVGGEDAGINEYPCMAALIDASKKEVVCGATIMSAHYVLTAAHCLRNILLGNMGVLVGDWDISTGTDTSQAMLYPASNVYEHPQFQVDSQINDLGIVRTKDPIVFNLYVGPVCLPFSYQYESFVYQTVTFLGWGQIFFNGPQSDVLEKVNVQVIQNTNCQSQYPNNVITDGQICTYTSGKDACQRDSGGPVIWQDPSSGRLYLVGVISYGLGCATTKPAVNSRVTSYLPWIVSIIQDTSFCAL